MILHPLVAQIVLTAMFWGTGIFFIVWVSYAMKADQEEDYETAD